MNIISLYEADLINRNSQTVSRTWKYSHKYLRILIKYSSWVNVVINSCFKDDFLQQVDCLRTRRLKCLPLVFHVRLTETQRVLHMCTNWRYFYMMWIFTFFPSLHFRGKWSIFTQLLLSDSFSFQITLQYIFWGGTTFSGGLIHVRCSGEYLWLQDGVCVHWCV